MLLSRDRARTGADSPGLALAPTHMSAFVPCSPAPTCHLGGEGLCGDSGEAPGPSGVRQDFCPQLYSPHGGPGLLATCLTPMESPKAAQGPSTRRAQAPVPLVRYLLLSSGKWRGRSPPTPSPAAGTPPGLKLARGPPQLSCCGSDLQPQPWLGWVSCTV